MTVGAALLIGNMGYGVGPFPKLRTPGSDVANLADRFQALGFDTVTFQDASRADMATAISRFRTKLDQLPAERNAFIYFAGHGIQHAGENYLVPVDARGEDALEVQLSCFRLSDLLSALCWRSDQQKWIALDMCRTNQIPGVTRGPQGLAGDSERRYENVREVSVLHATDPGHYALDGAAYGASPFCLGLLDALKYPHRPVRELSMQVIDYVCRMTQDMQRPWDTTTIRYIRPFVPFPPRDKIVRVLPDDMPWPDRFVATHGHWIHKLKAKDTTGRWAYYFILVEPDREPAFLRAADGDVTIDLEDYGNVVASSYGEEPTEEVKDYLLQRYGFAV